MASEMGGGGGYGDVKGDKFAALRTIYGYKKVETPSKNLKKWPIMCFARINKQPPFSVCGFIQSDYRKS